MTMTMVPLRLSTSMEMLRATVYRRRSTKRFVMRAISTAKSATFCQKIWRKAVAMWRPSMMNRPVWVQCRARCRCEQRPMMRRRHRARRVCRQLTKVSTARTKHVIAIANRSQPHPEWPSQSISMRVKRWTIENTKRSLSASKIVSNNSSSSDAIDEVYHSRNWTTHESHLAR